MPFLQWSSTCFNNMTCYNIMSCVYTQIDFSPLMEASRLGNVEIALLLLENGVNPNLQNTVRLELATYEVCMTLCTGRSVDCTNGSSK